MKVIFLDHQGVMYLKDALVLRKLDDFDLNAVEVLNEIIKKTNVEIVVSSDWKLRVSLDEMKKFYLKQGIHKQPIDYTPKYEEYKLSELPRQRSFEIRAWLHHNKNVTNWVSVDDLDMRKHIPNFAWVENINEGIKQKGLKEIILNYIK